MDGRTDGRLARRTTYRRMFNSSVRLCPIVTGCVRLCSVVFGCVRLCSVVSGCVLCLRLANEKQFGCYSLPLTYSVKPRVCMC